MAKFVAYYNICPIQDPKEFLGLSKDKEDGNIITTHGRNIIMIIKLSTQKQIRSWTVLEKLSSKVVYDPKSEQYIGVFSNQYIRCWSEDVKDINKIKKIKFHKSIVDLVCTGDNEPLILYSDGSCRPLSLGIHNRKEQPSESPTKDQHQAFYNSSIFTAANGEKMLTYFVKNQKENNFELVVTTLDEENLNPTGYSNKYSLNRRDQNVELAGYTVVEGQHYPSLFTIWSDKRIFMMPLTENTSPADAPGSFVYMIDILKVDSPISVIGISKNCVAVYGANSKQEGSSIILYNTQFKVVKAKQFFKIYFTFSKLWLVGNYILLAMGQNLSVVTFRVSRELLSEMIGSQISSDFQNYIGTDFINEEDEIKEGWSKKRKPKSIESIMEIQPNRDFYLDIELPSKENIDSDFEINLMVNYRDMGFINNEIKIICNELEKSGASEQEITEKLLPLLIKSDHSDDIFACLRRCVNISDMMIAKLLKYALTDITKDNEKNVNETKLNEENTFIKLSIKKQELLNEILSCSVNLDILAVHVRKEINYEQALYLIEHLHNLIENTDNCIEERPDTNSKLDEDLKIIQWFILILNTHFQELALSRDKYLIDLLVKWIELISIYIENLKDLDSLADMLYSLIECKYVSKEKSYTKWYSIEEVELY